MLISVKELIAFPLTCINLHRGEILQMGKSPKIYRFFPIMFRRFFLILFFAGFSLNALKAQEFGGNPPRKAWLALHTDSFHIIFNAPLLQKAREIAGILQALPALSGPTIGDRVENIPVVLQDGPVFSNGYVGLGPFRSEFYMLPPQNSFRLGGLPWHKSLALHEYRHIQQYNSFNTGIARLTGRILGQEARALVNNIAVPDYFWEGDAVYQETEFSRLGRGRIPHFYNNFHSAWAAEKNYSWHKWRNGSMKDLVPDHYQLGYLLVAYGRQQYGRDFWRKVSHDAVQFKGVFYPWQQAIKTHSGQHYRDFTRQALDYYKRQALTHNTDSLTAIGKRYEHFEGHQHFPQWVDSASLIYLNSSYKRIPEFIRRDIHSGNETRIGIKDISPDNHFSLNGEWLVYAALEVHPRWNWYQFSVIRKLNINTGKQYTLSSKTRYFSPDIDDSGKSIITVQVDAAGNSRLHLLDAEDGSLIREFPNTENWFYTYPKFYGDSQVVSAVRNPEGKMAVALTDLNAGTQQAFIPFTPSPVGFTQVSGDSIVFTRSDQGGDQLYCYTNGKLFRITLPGAGEISGNYHPDVHQGHWAWNISTIAGDRMIVSSDQALLAEPVQLNPDADPSPYQLHTPENKYFLDSVASLQNSAVTYPKNKGLVNFHSIRPYISDPDFSLSIISENILNTLAGDITLSYNRNEGYKRIGFNGTYAALFPWIRAGMNLTTGRTALLNGNRFRWTEGEGFIGYTIPLNLTGGKQYRSLRFDHDLSYLKRQFPEMVRDSFPWKDLLYTGLNLRFSSQVQQARQHIFPRFAQSLLISYRHALSSVDQQQFLASGSLYFPGIAVNHSIVFHGAYQTRNSGIAVFTNSFPFSRGYAAPNFKSMYRIGGTYHFPLWYPDLGFGNILYIYRLRTGVFYDHTITRNEALQQQFRFRSTGAELYFDTRWWNQQNIQFGIRYSRLMDTDVFGRYPHQLEFILPVNLFR